MVCWDFCKAYNLILSKYLCSRGVIVVTFNYRLGFFGFLTLDEKETPGNYALFDMTMALQWVHDNIHAFGGDNQKITVFGQSAGAVAVDYLSLSPHSSREFFRLNWGFKWFKTD